MLCGQRSSAAWTSRQVRSTFIDFFSSQGHKFVPSSSVIPKKGEGTYFTNAGMNQVCIFIIKFILHYFHVHSKGYIFLTLIYKFVPFFAFYQPIHFFKIFLLIHFSKFSYARHDTFIMARKYMLTSSCHT